MSSPQRSSWMASAVRWLALCLVAILVLRETGSLQVNSFRSACQRKVTSTLSTLRKTSLPEEGDPEATIVPHPGISVECRVPPAVQGIAAHEAASRLVDVESDDVGPCSGEARVNFDELSVSGLYWVPLHKSSTCKFEASIEMDLECDGGPRSVKGKVQGQIEITLTGLCSVRTLLEKVGEQVAEAIKEQLVGVQKD